MILEKKALIVCYSELASDPRVLKQINWLRNGGWEVDTLGLGQAPAGVQNHYRILKSGRSKVISGLAMLLLPYWVRFRLLTQTRISRLLTSDISSYDVVVVNEIDLLPWVKVAMKRSTNLRTHWNLDLHEYHEFEFPPAVPSLFRRPLKKYFNWKRKMIGSLDFDSYSTVASGIADLYSKEFKGLVFKLIFNSKPYEALTPSKVNPNKIELIYHGLAQMERGLDVLLAATPLLQPRFRVSMMLTGPTSHVDEVTRVANQLGAKIHWVRPVGMSKVSAAIQKYDLEIIFYPPKSMNLLYAFPNKFFEAVQARLGLVIGESPSMKTEVLKYGNGILVEGWSYKSLAERINSLTVQEIEQMKSASDVAATKLSEEIDQEKFLAQFR